MPKNKLRRMGWVVAALNIAMMFCSANYFLSVAKFPITAWFFFNICFSSTLIFLIGFFLKNRVIMNASIPFLAYFGTMGLFLFSWQGGWLAAQAGHIFMTFAIIYTVLEDIRAKEWKQPSFGIFIGLAIFLVFLPVHQKYIKNHPEFLKKLGDPKFEKIMGEKLGAR